MVSAFWLHESRSQKAEIALRCQTKARTSTPPNWRNSASSRIAGGTRRASSGRCTRSIRCGWDGSSSRLPWRARTVLDVGCGGGILAEAMARRGARVTGIDLAEKPLKVAQLHLLESRLEVRLRARRGRGFRCAPRGGLRRRHLHGAARARTRPGKHGRGMRAAPAPRRTRVLRHHQPQSEVLPVRGHRRRVRAAAAAAKARTTTGASCGPRSSRAGAATRGCARLR